MSTLKEFYKGFGLKDNPFASFTTENEATLFSRTFIKPNDYETILDNFSQKNSIILTGDRGTGKTALIKDFIDNINEDKTVWSHIVDFSSLDINYQINDFYKFVISSLSVSIFSTLADKKNRINKLNNEEKLLLCYLLKNFVPQISKSSLREKITNVQIPWYKRLYKKIENIFRGFFNYSATVGGSLIDEYIAKHFTGLPPLSDSVKIKDFFPELPVSVEEEFIDQDVSYQLIVRICKLSIKLGFERVLLIFDRVDEDQRFSNDAEAIAMFIVKILTDNKFLLEQNLQVVFSSWVTPFNYIKDQVRTQKHYCPTLTWNFRDLKKALNQRLKVYSDEKVSDYKHLFANDVTEDDINELFRLSNGNPRDLWHIFAALFKSQFELDASVNKIHAEAIPKALIQFVTNFNYYEYYPKKSNSRANSMDIYSYARHLLKLESEVFTKNQLNEKAQTGSSTNNYVVGMEKIGLIGLDSQQGGVAYYKIRDQKIVYALKNGLEIWRD